MPDGLDPSPAVQIPQPLLDDAPDVLYRVEVRAVPGPVHNSNVVGAEDSSAATRRVTRGFVLKLMF